MASHAPPSRTRESKAAGPIRARPAQAQRPRCLGPAAQLAAIHRTLRGTPIQSRAAPGEADQARTPERTGLPNRLRSGVEALSGLAMDDVRVHRDSPEPARLGALAYTQGSDIHLGPGQEAHLPHEAWHVVQQKQGRVKATTQAKGLELNDDGALEAEADRMGAAASEHSATRLDVRVHHRAPENPTIQRLVRHKTKILDTNKPYPKAIQHYSDMKDKLYVLKDTEEPEDSVVHLLESPKRYLIGESHDVDKDKLGTSRWATATAGWTSVTKAREGEQLSVSYGPNVLRESVGEISEGRTKKGMPSNYYAGPQATLENVHEWLLAAVSESIEIIDDLSPKNVKSDLKYQPDILADTLHELIANLENLSQEWYNDFIIVYEGLVKLDEIRPSPELDAVYNFHRDFRDDYRQIIIDMKLQAALLCIITEGKKKKYDMVREDFKSPEVHAEKLRVYSSFLAYLLVDFEKLAKVTEKEHKKIVHRLFGRKLHGGDPATERDKNLTITSPPRERAMIANLEAIPDEDCPVLVQIGDDHVKPVKRGLGDKAVAVREKKELDDLTDYKNPPR